MPHTSPYELRPGDEILAERLQANFQSLSDKFSARIVGADIDPAANIAGTTLQDNTTPSAKLQTISAAEVIRLLPALGIALDKLKITVHDQAGSNTFGTAPSSQNVYIASEISGGNWRARAGVFAIVAGALNHGVVTVTPSVAFPSSTYQLIAAYAKDPTVATNTVNFTVRFIFISLT